MLSGAVGGVGCGMFSAVGGLDVGAQGRSPGDPFLLMSVTSGEVLSRVSSFSAVSIGQAVPLWGAFVAGSRGGEGWGRGVGVGRPVVSSEAGREEGL